MNRRNFIKTASLSAAGVAIANRGIEAKPQNDRPMIIDGMGEIRLEYPMSLIAEILASGTVAVQITLGNPSFHGSNAYESVLNEIAAYERHIDVNRKYLKKATCVADINQAKNENRLALSYLFQNITPIQDDLSRLDFFYNLGVRCIQLTYNSRNLIGDGCMERVQSGISKFGLRVIEKMNEMGILIDLSHASMPTTAEAIKFSKKPVVISHSTCETVYNHLRSVNDENLKALGNNGGVIGICQLNPFVSSKDRSDLNDYLKHIDHAVKVAGIESVGIGSDREHKVIPDTEEEKRKLSEELASIGITDFHWPFFISELNHPRRMETIWDGLKKRGYKSADIEKIMGQNFYRLFKEVIG